MLAGAALDDGGRAAAGGDPRGALGVGVGQVGGVLQVRLGEAGTGQDAADPVEVEGLCRVARRGEGQEVGRQVEAGADHGEGLDRLERRAGQDRAGGVARRHEDRAGRVGRHGGGPVDRLDEAAAGHLDEDLGVGEDGRRAGGGHGSGVGLRWHAENPRPDRSRPRRRAASPGAAAGRRRGHATSRGSMTLLRLVRGHLGRSPDRVTGRRDPGCVAAVSRRPSRRPSWRPWSTSPRSCGRSCPWPWPRCGCGSSPCGSSSGSAWRPCGSS